jgi:hypothetical protein
MAIEYLRVSDAIGAIFIVSDPCANMGAATHGDEKRIASGNARFAIRIMGYD